MAMFHSKLLVYPSGIGSNTGWHPSGDSDEVMAVFSGTALDEIDLLYI